MEQNAAEPASPEGPTQVIGILTLADLSNANYGAFMQAWALKQALTKVATTQQDINTTNTVNIANGGGVLVI